jgi:hypothetical protein
MFFFQVLALAGRFIVLGISITYFHLPLTHCIAALAIFNIVLYSAQLSYVLILLGLSWVKHIIIVISVSAGFIAFMLGVKEFFIRFFL